MDFTEILKCFIVFIMQLILCGTLLVVYAEVGFSLHNLRFICSWLRPSGVEGLMSLSGCTSLLLQGMLKSRVKKVLNLDISVSWMGGTWAVMCV